MLQAHRRRWTREILRRMSDASMTQSIYRVFFPFTDLWKKVMNCSLYLANLRGIN